MQKIIVIFGGSFNPPTNSHFALAEQVRCSNQAIEKVIFVPVADHYPKEDLMDSSYRIEMLKRVCAKNPYFEVGEIEVNAPKLLNTIDTLDAFQSMYPDYEICLILGTDNLKYMTSWQGYHELVQRYKCLVLERDQDSFATIISSQQELNKYKERFILLTDMIHSDCNATLLRKSIRQGKSIRYMVPDEVYLYIEEKGLYTIIETGESI